MEEAKPVRYDGPRDGLNYMEYDGRFWKKLCFQSWYRHLGMFADIGDFYGV